MLTTHAAAASRVPYFGQAQSHLEAFDDKPLISGNWTGRYRPYVLDHGGLVPLLAERDVDASRLDLYSPLPLSGHEIVLAGSDTGRPEYDLFTYDTAVRGLVNLTATPAIDDGRACVQSEARLVAFRAGDEERVARLGTRLEELRHERLPAFEHCTWTSRDAFVGIASQAGRYQLYRCTLLLEGATCTVSPALAEVDSVVGFLRDTPGGIGLVARRRGDFFRSPFVLPDSLGTLAPMPLTRAVRGDVLDVQGAVIRSGFHSRYASSLAPESPATVYVTRRIGRDDFGIVATDRMPRTLARAAEGGWELLPHRSVDIPDHVFTPREIWMRSTSGERYQAFYVGPPAPERIVIWWHGGPQENVSPRFNAYFHRLNTLGFGVLAVNYPGSTGRGAEYERRFEDRSLRDCVDAVWSFVRDSGTRVVVSWSVSTGVRLQTVLLAQGVPVSAIVDQAAWGRSTLVADTARRGVPFFVIRGRHDPRGPIERVDFLYDGGHDLSSADDFAALFDAIASFLRDAPAMSYERAHDGRARLLVEIPAQPDDGHPLGSDEQALGFELATHLARDCFKAGEVAFSVNSDVDLASAARVRERIARWRARQPQTPLARIHLGRPDRPSVPPAAESPAAGDAARRTVVFDALDDRTAEEERGLRHVTIDPDGSLVRPRLRRVAHELCPRLRALAE